MANRAEDMFRRMMGMPTRKEQRRQERRQAAAGRRGRGGNSSQGRGGRGPYAGESGYAGGGYTGGRAADDPAAMMKSVAEDVEYTEYVEYESTEIAEDDGKTTRIVREEQVSDVEYVEIKKKTT